MPVRNDPTVRPAATRAMPTTTAPAPTPTIPPAPTTTSPTTAAFPAAPSDDAVRDAVARASSPRTGASAVDVRAGAVTSLVDDPAWDGRVGPLPDFAPAAGVLLHAWIDEVAPDFRRKLVDAYGHKLQITLTDQDVSKSDKSEAWMRDYAPLRARTKSGERLLVAALSVFPKRSLRFGGEKPPVHAPADAYMHRAPTGPITSGPLAASWWRHRSMDLLAEGGNVVAGGRHVLATTKIVDDNAHDPRAAHLRGFVARDEAAVRAEFARALDLAVDDVVLLRPLPGEKTKHVDMFVAALPSGRLLVPSIDDEAMGAITYGHEIALAQQARAHLDETAARLTALGEDVVRAPMMPAVFLEPSPDRAEGWTGRYLSPTNAALFDVDGRKRAFLPTFAADGFPDAYKAVADKCVAAWEKLFASEGFTPVRVDAGRALMANGLLRCLSAPLP